MQATEKSWCPMERVDGLRKRLPTDLMRLAAKHDVPGVSMAVLIGDEVVEATYGVVNTHTRVPVTPDSLFMIQSITKVFTATLIMQLADESRVGLDDPVRSVLPDFRTADAQVSSQITVRHLLTHSGGFDGDIWAATTSGTDALPRFVEDLVSQAPQHFGPGQQFSYCNAGYGVLGRIVEVLRGMTYENALRHYLAEPLEIDEIAFSADQALAFRTAIGHVRTNQDEGLRPLRHWAVMPPSNPAAGNQLAMSARGLLALARMHLDDGRTPDQTSVLSISSSGLMRNRQIDHPAAVGTPSSHGLGWWLDRGELVEHGGGSTGVAAMLRTSPRHHVAAAVLTNADSGAALIDELIEPWFADLAGVAPKTSLPKPGRVDLTFDASHYLGRYADRQHHVELVRDDHDGRLWLSDEPQGDSLEMARRAGTTASTQRHELRPWNGDTFLIIDAQGQPTGSVEFLDRDGQGQSRLLYVGGRAVPRIDPTSDQRP
jgi:CubicO group peptidase (beta-lactamase class C family)